MLRYLSRALVIIPFALLLAHFFGYAYAYFVSPIQASRNPMYVGSVIRGPLLPNYVEHLGQALRLDLGEVPGSRAFEPLLNVLANATIASLGLLALSLALSILVGIGIGLFSVRDNPPRVAAWLTTATTIGLATPTFFFGVLGVTAVIVFLIWAPGRPVILPLNGYGWDLHLVLPTIALMLRPTAQIAQITAGMMANELSRQYVVTARSVGNAERRILRYHVLRNALPAIISTIAASLRLMAGELIIVETLFYWPGLGRLIAQALIPSNHSVAGESLLFLNPPVLASTLLLFAAIFLFSNLFANLIMRALDPRLREA